MSEEYYIFTLVWHVDPSLNWKLSVTYELVPLHSLSQTHVTIQSNENLSTILIFASVLSNVTELNNKINPKN